VSGGQVIERPALSQAQALRRAAGAAVVDGFFYATAMGFSLHPLAQPALHGLKVERDVPYRDGGHPQHQLDVWQPKSARGPLPVVIYIHGGGFRFLSKDTHWIFAMIFARRGYLVFNLDYRLAPGNPFPAAVEDVCAAYEFVVKNARRWGGDPERLVIAGESAGANLSTVLALSAVEKRPEAFARKVYDTGIVPRAVVPACGIHHVSDPEGRGLKSRFLYDRVAEVTDAYLGGVRLAHPRALELVDPVVTLEKAEGFDRPLPAFYVPCGTWDIMLPDNKRLVAALERHGAPVASRWFEREMHAFHGFAVTPGALKCWRETFDFLAQHV
jgi:acetyl esterase